MKHNKKRNTAFAYEVLVRELTKSMVEKNVGRKDEVYSILKEFFTKGAPLAQEMSLYNVLLETENIQHHLAERLIQETKKARAQLDERAIFSAQSQLIKAINKNLGAEVWGNFVPNYKSLASVNHVFNTKAPVKKRVLFEQAIVDRMSAQKDRRDNTVLQPLDNLTYRSFIKKYNEKYAHLLQEQKDLLNRYITSFADDGLELRLYLNEELSRLKSALTHITENYDEALIVQKVEAVLEYLEGFRKRPMTDDDVTKILNTQELVQELSLND